MPNLINQIQPDWKIITADGPLSESQASFDPDNTTAMIPYRVPRDDLDIVPQYFTGYSYVFIPPTGSTDATLRRILPQPHPFWKGLWGSRINVQGESGWDNANPITKGQKDGPYDAYDEYRVEVYYARRPYDVLDNGEVSKEQERYVEKHPGKPYSEMLALEGLELKFADGTAAIGGQGIRVGKADIKWTWHEVPLKWALNGSGVASNINAAIGTINNGMWEGYPSGTLMLDTVDMDYTYSTSTPVVLGLAAYSPPRYLKITFGFKYFSHGWNNILRPGTRSWEQVTFKIDGQTLYASSNFDTLFQKAF